jgi:phytoene dehydrogenase-like protein
VSRGDVIVIGAGHNGLACALLLARGGRKVVVLERRDRIGGIAASEEFHPGYRSAGLFAEANRVLPTTLTRLGLEAHGLSVRPERPGILALGSGGKGIFIDGDVGRASAGLRSASPRDAEAYPRFRAALDKYAEILRSFLSEPALDLVKIESNGPLDMLRRAWRVRRLGKSEMLELLRLPAMSVADLLSEWFETDLLKAALALPAISGTWLGPRSPSTALNYLLWEATAGPGVAGGGPALVAALEKAARAAGVEIRTSATVERVRVADGGVRGVTLTGGEEIAAATVAAACDPKQALLSLLEPGTIPYRAERRIGGFRTRGTTAQVLLALTAPPRFAARPDGSTELARTGAHLDDLERAFDAIKYRRMSETPILEIHVPSVGTPGLAPTGGAVVSILVHFAPYELEGGWNEAVRERLGDLVVAMLERHAPGLAKSVAGRQVLTPVDLAARYALPQGHPHHGEHSLDQWLVRPTPECGRYATPVPGLFLCSSGVHPGGGLTCGPGTLAADAILNG